VRGRDDVAADKKAIDDLLEEFADLMISIDNPTASAILRVNVHDMVAEARQVALTHQGPPKHLELDSFQQLADTYGRGNTNKRARDLPERVMGRRRRKKPAVQAVQPAVQALPRQSANTKADTMTVPSDDEPDTAKGGSVAKQPADQRSTSAAAAFITMKRQGLVPHQRLQRFSVSPQSAGDAALLLSMDDQRLSAGQQLEVFWEADATKERPAGWWAGRVRSVKRQQIHVQYLDGSNGTMAMQEAIEQGWVRFF
jgi:hypothetical protein